MFETGTRANRRQSRGALLLACVLLPGWILPPACAACPHGTSDDALQVVSSADVDDHAQGRAHVDDAPASEGHRLDEAAQDAAAGHGEHDCGCPCDLECAAPDLAMPHASATDSAREGDAPVATIEATALRPAEPRFPAFFLPLSNAPPR